MGYLANKHSLCALRKMMAKVLRGEMLFHIVGGNFLGAVVGGDWSQERAKP
jgi:hypothetical protein